MADIQYIFTVCGLLIMSNEALNLPRTAFNGLNQEACMQGVALPKWGLTSQAWIRGTTLLSDTTASFSKGWKGIQ